MSARDLPMQLVGIDRMLDDRAIRILTDANYHEPAVLKWAVLRVPLLAGFKQSELALAQYEIHRT